MLHCGPLRGFGRLRQLERTTRVSNVAVSTEGTAQDQPTVSWASVSVETVIVLAGC